MTENFIKNMVSVGAIVLMSTMSTVALSAGLEEVVVTAQKTEQSQQDIPISITALSEERIDKLGLTDTTEITQQVPGFQLNAWSPNVTIFNLRGVSQNNFTDILEAPVAVYFDDSYVASINGISGQLFDIKRVEVVRGPQGTLFGRNATGGLVHYVSKGADEEEFNGHFKIITGDYNQQNIELAIGGGDESTRVRFAVRTESADGYVESRNVGIFGTGPDDFPLPGSGQDIGGKDGIAWRLNIQADLDDGVVGDFWIKFAEDDNVPTGGYVFERCAPAPQDPTLCDTDVNGRARVIGGPIDGITGENASPYNHFGENPGSLNRETNSFQAKFTVDLDEGTFTSITNYLTLTKSYTEDGDALPLLLVNFETDLDFTQLSQEFRYSEESEDANWQVGAYYLDIDHSGMFASLVPQPITVFSIQPALARLFAQR